MTDEKKRWLIQAPLGLIGVGLGLCLFSEAGHLKHGGAPLSTWILWGTVSLVVINAGLVLLVDRGLWKLRDEIKDRRPGEDP